MKIEFLLDKQKKPHSEKGMKVIYGGTKRTGYRIRWFLLVMAIISPLIFAAYYFMRSSILVIAPAIITYNPVGIDAPHEGMLVSIYPQEGDEIDKGAPLFKLEDNILNAEIAFLQKQLDKLKQFDEQRRQTNLNYYLNAITNAQLHQKKMQEIKLKFDDYVKKGNISTVDYAAILASYTQANKNVLDANISYEQAQLTLENQKIVGEVATAIRDIEKALSNKNSLRESLSVNTPFDAKVIEIQKLKGHNLRAGDDVLLISAKGASPQITAYLDSKYVSIAQVGQVAKIKFASGMKQTATVTKPTQLTSEIPSSLSKPFETRTALMKVTLSFKDDFKDETNILEGMPVEVIF
ncbi:HlyD family secretion protein [Psychromonas sp.]|uniref:HlyD family secretion protein n=1 Tax=Psychromonas sp. TaxID=1884585 RepID=UPI0035674E7A